MMNLENNITLKIKYHSQNKSRIVEYIQNYNSVVKYTYINSARKMSPFRVAI